jgi:hypothetical protein
VIGAGAALYGLGPEAYPSGGALAALAAEWLATLTAEEALAIARVPEGRIDSPDKARGLAVLGPARPIYLRRPDAQMPGAPKRVTA